MLWSYLLSTGKSWPLPRQVLQNRHDGERGIVVTLDEKRVALGIELLREIVNERDEEALVLAKERRYRVERACRGNVQTPALVVAAPEKRTSLAVGLVLLIACKDAGTASCVKSPADAADRVFGAADELDTRIIRAVGRNRDLTAM